MSEVKKVPVIEYVVQRVPKYEIVKEELKVPVLKEVPVEGISKKDLDLLKAYGAELTSIYQKLEKIKNYRITEEEVRVKRPVFVDEQVKRAVFTDENIKIQRYIEEKKKIEIPVLVEKKVEGISKDDLALIKEMVLYLKELRSELEKVRNFKIKEENFVVEKPIYKPKIVEIETEKVNWVISDIVVETLEDLVKKLKSEKGFK